MCIMMTAPSAKLGATTAPRPSSRHFSSSCERKSGLRPDVPMTGRTPAASAARATTGARSAPVKSTTTSALDWLKKASGSMERSSVPAGSMSGSAARARTTSVPILPVPLTTTRIVMALLWRLPALYWRAGWRWRRLAGAAPETGVSPATAGPSAAHRRAGASRAWAAASASLRSAVAAAEATISLRSAVSATIASAISAAKAATSRASLLLSLGGGGTAGRYRFLQRLAFDDGSPREVDAAHAVDFDDHDHDLVAQLDHVLRAAYRRLGKLFHADQAFLARQDLHKGAEADDSRHLAGVDLAQLHFAGHALDDADRLLSRLLIVGADEDGAVVLDVDAALRLFDNRADHAAAGADHCADLVLRDLDAVHARREGRKLRPRRRDGLTHALQDEEPGVAGLIHRLVQDIEADALDLDVHLQGSDAL